MRRMFSENQIKKMVEESPAEIKEALKGQDVEINGLTSKGIANTGGLANIGNVAISGDLSASGDLTAKTLSQSEANWSYNLSLEGITFPEGITAEIKYSRLEIINGVLYFVSSIKVSNTTESAISLNDYAINVTLPEEIASKIFDIEGTPATETVPTGTLITEFALYRSNLGGTATTSVARIGNHTTANTITIRVISSASVNANTQVYYTGRTFLTIL